MRTKLSALCVSLAIAGLTGASASVAETHVSSGNGSTGTEAAGHGATAHGAKEHGKNFTGQDIDHQRLALSENTRDKGFGPQSPRDLGSIRGNNRRALGTAPPHTEMNLCNLHFHKNAEHRGGDFTTYAGPGDGHGFGTGYVYSGRLSRDESKPIKKKICASEHGGLNAGDTIEVHYVYSTADVKPGPTLNACMNEAIVNPQLRVEAQVFVLVNDKKALDFTALAEHGEVDGLHQALHIPTNTGEPVQYAGSTTGPSYNEKGSPFQVTWSVRPKIAKVNVESVGKWCAGNEFKEDHAHGVRTLVVNPDLLSAIKR